MLHGSTGRALGSGPRDSWFEPRWGSGNAETRNLGAVPSRAWQGAHLGQVRAATCADAEARSVERIGRATSPSNWEFAGSSPARTTRGRRTLYAPNLINWGKLVSGSFSIQLLRSRGPQRGVGQLAARLAVNQVSLDVAGSNPVTSTAAKPAAKTAQRSRQRAGRGGLSLLCAARARGNGAPGQRTMESACVLADTAGLLNPWPFWTGVRISLSPPERAVVQ